MPLPVDNLLVKRSTKVTTKVKSESIETTPREGVAEINTAVSTQPQENVNSKKETVVSVDSNSIMVESQVSKKQSVQVSSPKKAVEHPVSVDDSTDQVSKTQIEKAVLEVPPIISSIHSIQQHIIRAVKKLSTGSEHRARLELTAALDKKPGHPEATLLMEQIDLPADRYFETKSDFQYVLRANDTLMSVAEKYLGNRLKFYILAKYNNIKVPSSVLPGTVVKVPGEQPTVELTRQSNKVKHESTSVFVADKSRSTLSSVDTVSEKISQATALYDDGQYLGAIDLLHTINITNKTPKIVPQLLEQAYIKYTNELLSRSSLLEAQALLESATNSLPDNERLHKQLVIVKSRREAEKLFKIGLSELTAGNPTEAFEVFSKAIELNPKHMLAQKQLQSLKTNVVGLYHKRAMQHYIKQELDEAIRVWTGVLEIEPGHAMARVYLEKAKNLKKRFNRL